MKLQCGWVAHLLLIVKIVTTSAVVEDCDIRFEDNGACACSSHDTTGQVTCYQDGSIKIRPCYCMYYDSTQNLSIVGHCFYSCYQFWGTVDNINNSAELNAEICRAYGNINRVGRFCGQCIANYGLAAYSYQLWSCIPCQDYGYKNWLRYFAVAFLPLTVFYILAVLLSFNVTSSSLNGPVLVIQCILSPFQIIIVQGNYASYPLVIIPVKLVTSIFCTLNLDFFRLVYPPFCLHPKANIFQILSLDYLVALYPFLLIFVTYVLVTAHDKQYRLVLWVWRPVRRCVHRHRNTWNIRSSLIEIFATFILLSYVKILGVTLQILAFTSTYDVAGNSLGHYYTYYDGTMEYFGSAHLPYALLAIAVSSLFVVLPFFLLAVYPCRCFHKCLNYCGLNSQALHIFMDAFQGSYRTQPRDLRYFSAFYLLLRILMTLQFEVALSSLPFFTSGILSFLSAAIVVVFQPYKVKIYNTIDSVLMIQMGIYFTSYYVSILTSSLLYSDHWDFASVIQGLAIGTTLLYFLGLILWKLLGGKLQVMVGKAKVVWSSLVHCPAREYSRGEEIESFDRELDTSGTNSYPPLLRESQEPTY